MLAVGPIFDPLSHECASKPWRVRNSLKRDVDVSVEQNPGMTMTGCPAPFAASLGKGGGEALILLRAETSRNHVAIDTGESRDGQIATAERLDVRARCTFGVEREYSLRRTRRTRISPPLLFPNAAIRAHLDAEAQPGRMSALGLNHPVN
jgi:hypothetical protein